MLEKAAAGGAGRTPNEQKIGDSYAACMDVDTINQKGLTPLQMELDRITALKSKDELPELLARFQLIGVNAFLNFGEQQDFKDARKQIAVVDQGGLGLPERDYYFRTGDAAAKTRAQYVQHIANMFKLTGESEKKAVSDAQAIMELETALAKVSMDITSRRDPNKVYHLMPVSELATLAPGVAWDRFLVASGAPKVSELNVANPDFVKGLNSLLASTDLETIKTYLRWQLILSTPGYVLPKALDDERFDFYGRKLRGQPEQRARWKRCVQATDAGLGEALGQVYVAQEFSPANKQATLQMVEDIEAAMDQDIDTLDWMSPATKVRAKEKLRAVADKIGYPDHWRDYSSLVIARDDAFGNALRATAFENRRQLAKIGKPVDRGEWVISPATVDAYYNPSMNDINFPAGILQSPLYDSHASDASNYGHVGGIVGHELTHGFDDEGRQFDANGNLADWWTAEDGKHFEEKADCEVKEYSNFVAVDDVKVNGKLTLGENTADNGGLRLAYIAFLADAKRKNIDLTKAGRLHAHPAILPGTRTELVRQHPSRATPAAGADRSAFAPAIPGERRSAEHAGVRPGLRLQDRSTHDAGQCLPGVVRPREVWRRMGRLVCARPALRFIARNRPRRYRDALFSTLRPTDSRPYSCLRVRPTAAAEPASSLLRA